MTHKNDNWFDMFWNDLTQFGDMIGLDQKWSVLMWNESLSCVLNQHVLS